MTNQQYFYPDDAEPHLKSLWSIASRIEEFDVDSAMDLRAAHTFLTNLVKYYAQEQEASKDEV